MTSRRLSSMSRAGSTSATAGTTASTERSRSRSARKAMSPVSRAPTARGDLHREHPPRGRGARPQARTRAKTLGAARSAPGAPGRWALAWSLSQLRGRPSSSATAHASVRTASPPRRPRRGRASRPAPDRPAPSPRRPRHGPPLRPPLRPPGGPAGRRAGSEPSRMTGRLSSSSPVTRRPGPARRGGPRSTAPAWRSGPSPRAHPPS